jgi:hypothetical protein
VSMHLPRYPVYFRSYFDANLAPTPPLLRRLHVARLFAIVVSRVATADQLLLQLAMHRHPRTSRFL